MPPLFMKMCWHILHFSFRQFVHDFKVSGKMVQYSPKKGSLFSFLLTFYLHIYEDQFLFGAKISPIILEFSWYISYRYHTNFLDIHPQSCFLPICIFAGFQFKLWLKTSTQDFNWTFNTTLRYNLNSRPKLLFYQLKAHL